MKPETFNEPAQGGIPLPHLYDLAVILKSWKEGHPDLWRGLERLYNDVQDVGPNLLDVFDSYGLLKADKRLSDHVAKILDSGVLNQPVPKIQEHYLAMLPHFSGA